MLALAAAITAMPPHPMDPTPGPITRHLERTIFQAPPALAHTQFAQAGTPDSLKNGAAVGAHRAQKAEHFDVEAAPAAAASERSESSRSAWGWGPTRS
jgi:hypothetical protein